MVGGSGEGSAGGFDEGHLRKEKKIENGQYSIETADIKKKGPHQWILHPPKPPFTY